MKAQTDFNILLKKGILIGAKPHRGIDAQRKDAKTRA
jgi:hypothetical protein